MTRKKPRKRRPQTDWTTATERARAEMARARAETLSGEAYRAQAPSSWRLGGRRAEGRFD